MSRLPFAIALLLLIALIGIGSGVAWAHPLLLRANPPPDTILHRAPARVQLVFSEDLNASGSTISVVGQHGRAFSVGRAFLTHGNPREIDAQLRRLPPGSYLVRWTVVSAEDGHVVHGSYVFGVNCSDRCKARFLEDPERFTTPSPDRAGIPV